jgi:hypothetical protein
MYFGPLWDQKWRAWTQSTTFSQFLQLPIGYDSHVPQVRKQLHVGFFPQFLAVGEDIVLLIDVLHPLIPCVLAFLPRSDPWA